MELNDIVTVVVGRGIGEPKEFECLAALLMQWSFFVTMFQKELRESKEKKIELPYISPSSWEEFEKIIRPRQPGKNYDLTLENVPVLLPLVHYFGMTDWVDHCEAKWIDYLESITSEDKHVCNDNIAEFWREGVDNLEERSTMFGNIVTLYKGAYMHTLQKLRSLATNKLVYLLRWIEHTADLFSGDIIQELVPRIDFTQTDNDELEQVFMTIIGDNISHESEGGSHPRHVFDFISTILQREALERRVRQLEPQVSGAKKILSHVYKDYPLDFYGRLPHDNPHSTLGSLEESKARQTLLEMLRGSHAFFHQEHELLGIEGPTVDDMWTIESQIRDAVYHYIKSNDEGGKVPVSMNDIYNYIAPIFRSSSKSIDESGKILADAVQFLLRDFRIATYNNQNKQFVSIWRRRQFNY